MTTVSGPDAGSVRADAFLRWGTERLKAAGLAADARREARLLLAAAEQVTPEHLIAYPEHPLSREETARRFVERRAAREPISRILGRRSFWKHEFVIGPAVLDPRPDTETLIEVVLQRRPDLNEPLRIADLGVGSGCILLSLLGEYPQARGVGVDLSPGALEIAAVNARALEAETRCTLHRGSWCAPLESGFDVIVSNPPYIESDAIAGLEPEVGNHDPHLALDGGADGLDAYRRILDCVPGRLKTGGLLAVEVGWTQAAAVSDLFTWAGLSEVLTHADLSGAERIVSGLRL